MKKKLLLLFLVVIIIVLGLLVAWRVQSNKQPSHARHHANKPMSVDTALVEQRPMPLLLKSVGQVEPEHSVQIQPQVTGVLKRVYFTEGQTVHAGQRLFKIDPAPYQAELASAKSAWISAKANADRMAPLASKDYVTPQEFENARTSADQAKATFEQAKINLAYTEIRAPITGEQDAGTESGAGCN